MISTIIKSLMYGIRFRKGVPNIEVVVKILIVVVISIVVIKAFEF